MSQRQLLNRVLDVLQSLGVEYMLTGSWASSLQGQPRSTHDLDLVVSLHEGLIRRFTTAFAAPDYYLSAASMSEAIRNQSMFNLLDNQTGDKVDFWMLTDDPWDIERFSRRLSVDIGGRAVAVSSPEDTVLAKLRWSAMSGGSERQFRDALHVSELQWEVLEQGYLRKWSKHLGVQKEWRRIVTLLGKT